MLSTSCCIADKKRQENTCLSSVEAPHSRRHTQPRWCLGGSLQHYCQPSRRPLRSAPPTHDNKCTIWRVTLLKLFSVLYTMALSPNILRASEARIGHRALFGRDGSPGSGSTCPGMGLGRFLVACAWPCLHYCLRRRMSLGPSKILALFLELAPALPHPHHHFQPTRQSSTIHHPPFSLSAQHALLDIDTKTSIQNILPTCTPTLQPPQRQTNPARLSMHSLHPNTFATRPPQKLQIFRTLRKPCSNHSRSYG